VYLVKIIAFIFVVRAFHRVKVALTALEGKTLGVQ